MIFPCPVFYLIIKTALLRKIKSIYNEITGEINALQHQIAFIPEFRPISNPPYPAKYRPRESKKAEVERKLKLGVSIA